MALRLGALSASPLVRGAKGGWLRGPGGDRSGPVADVRAGRVDAAYVLYDLFYVRVYVVSVRVPLVSLRETPVRGGPEWSRGGSQPENRLGARGVTGRGGPWRRPRRERARSPSKRVGLRHRGGAATRAGGSVAGEGPGPGRVRGWRSDRRPQGEEEGLRQKLFLTRRAPVRSEEEGTPFSAARI